MSNVLEAGNKVHIVTRRHFKEDLRRHFVGEVTAVVGSAIQAEGYTFIFDENKAAFIRKPERRVRVFGATDSGFIVNLIPNDTHIESVAYQIAADGNLVCTDGKNFSLDVNEFSATR